MEENYLIDTPSSTTNDYLSTYGWDLKLFMEKRVRDDLFFTFSEGINFQFKKTLIEKLT